MSVGGCEETGFCQCELWALLISSLLCLTVLITVHSNLLIYYHGIDFQDYLFQCFRATFKDLVVLGISEFVAHTAEGYFLLFRRIASPGCWQIWCSEGLLPGFQLIIFLCMLLVKSREKGFDLWMPRSLPNCHQLLYLLVQYMMAMNFMWTCSTNSSSCTSALLINLKERDGHLPCILLVHSPGGHHGQDSARTSAGSPTGMAGHGRGDHVCPVWPLLCAWPIRDSRTVR